MDRRARAATSRGAAVRSNSTDAGNAERSRSSGGGAGCRAARAAQRMDVAGTSPSRGRNGDGGGQIRRVFKRRSRPSQRPHTRLLRPTRSTRPPHVASSGLHGFFHRIVVAVADVFVTRGHWAHGGLVNSLRQVAAGLHGSGRRAAQSQRGDRPGHSPGRWCALDDVPTPAVGQPVAFNHRKHTEQLKIRLPAVPSVPTPTVPMRGRPAQTCVMCVTKCLGRRPLRHLVTHHTRLGARQPRMGARGIVLMAQLAGDLQLLGVLAVIERHRLSHGWRSEQDRVRTSDQENGQDDRHAGSEPARRPEPCNHAGSDLPQAVDKTSVCWPSGRV